jgi:hypothetical protein
MPDTLKRKYIAAKKGQTIKEKEAEFKKKHGREPATDSEIDEVYGAGAATAAMDEVYERMKKNK